MSKGGSVKEQLRIATEALEEEQKLWNENGIQPNAWRMGDSEFYMVCQMITMYELMKDVLGVEEDVFTTKLRIVTRRELSKLREKIMAQQRDELHRKLTEGIEFRPPPDILGRNGGV